MAGSFAVISDIHGNLPALEAVMADIDRRGVEEVVCLGDLAYKGPFPGECVERIRELAIPTVRGNTDDDLARAGERARSRAPGAAAPGRGGCRRAGDARGAPAADERAAWHLARLGPTGLAFLGGLPHEFRRQAFGWRWLFVHATPKDLRDAIAPEDDDDAIRRKIAGAEADAIVMGHIHRPYVRRVGSTLLINTGAVGAPFDGDPRASYLLVEEAGGEGPRLTHVRVAYPVEATLRAARERAFPFDLDDYARLLQTGRN